MTYGQKDQQMDESNFIGSCSNNAVHPTNDCIKDKSVLAEMFSNHYTNIFEDTSSIAPESTEGFSLPENDEETVNRMLKHYENHPSVSKN